MQLEKQVRRQLIFADVAKNLWPEWTILADSAGIILTHQHLPLSLQIPGSIFELDHHGQIVLPFYPVKHQNRFDPQIWQTRNDGWMLFGDYDAKRKLIVSSNPDDATAYAEIVVRRDGTPALKDPAVAEKYHGLIDYCAQEIQSNLQVECCIFQTNDDLFEELLKLTIAHKQKLLDNYRRRNDFLMNRRKYRQKFTGFDTSKMSENYDFDFGQSDDYVLLIDLAGDGSQAETKYFYDQENWDRFLADYLSYIKDK